MPDLFDTAGPPRPPASLLDGLPGRPGFLFHDAFNQPVHLAAPGLLGLVEARLMMERWKPRSVAWLDGTLHFFDHVVAEFEGYAAFEPVRAELQAIRELDAPCPARNAFLFRYIGALNRELERERHAGAPLTAVAGSAGSELSLCGTWSVRLRSGEGWADSELDVPTNWELVPGIDDYAGTMRFTRAFTWPDTPEGPVELRFAGVDYFADVWLNGWHLGGHEGYFEPFTFDVTPYLRPNGDANLLRVAVTSPNDPSGPGTHVTSGWHDVSSTSAFPNRKTLVKGTLGHHDAKRGGAWSSITSQDGNTGGIWNSVALSVPAFPVNGVWVASTMSPQVNVWPLDVTERGSSQNASAAECSKIIPPRSAMARARPSRYLRGWKRACPSKRIPGPPTNGSSSMNSASNPSSAASCASRRSSDLTASSIGCATGA